MGNESVDTRHQPGCIQPSAGTIQAHHGMRHHGAPQGGCGQRSRTPVEGLLLAGQYHDSDRAALVLDHGIGPGGGRITQVFGVAEQPRQIGLAVTGLGQSLQHGDETLGEIVRGGGRLDVQYPVAVCGNGVREGSAIVDIDQKSHSCRPLGRRKSRRADGVDIDGNGLAPTSCFEATARPCV